MDSFYVFMFYGQIDSPANYWLSYVYIENFNDTIIAIGGGGEDNCGRVDRITLCINVL